MSVIGTAAVENISRTDDDTGNRTYTVEFLVKTNNKNDWASVIANAPGLPLIGAPYTYGNDFDPFCICHPSLSVKMINKPRQGEYSYIWKVTRKFSTLPFKNEEGGQRCFNTQIEDPLAEPPQFSGSFVNYTKEVQYDRNGDLIVNSSHQLITGKVTEFDDGKPTVNCSLNVINLNLPTLVDAYQKVNSAPMWGLTARKIKLSNIEWERRILGTCGFYYNVSFGFDVDFLTFDRTVPDEGTMVLHGHWGPSGWVVDELPNGGGTPDPTNPEHFQQAKDRKGENIKAFLDGSGKPVSDIANAATIDIEYYGEFNFLSLGIPITF